MHGYGTFRFGKVEGRTFYAAWFEKDVSKPSGPRKIEKSTVNVSTENADRTARLDRNKHT